MRGGAARWLATMAALGAGAVIPIGAIGAIGTTGCGSRDELRGSISGDFSLEFDGVEVWSRDDTLFVDYVKNDGELFGRSIPCRLVLETADVTVTPGAPIAGDALLDALTISRLAAYGGDFPSVRSATVTFTTFSLDAGEMIAGQFDALFDNGREIRGIFAQRLRKDDTP